jgi:predicted porin
MINRRSLAILIPLCLYSGNINAKEIYNQNKNTVDVYAEINPLYFYAHTTDPFILNALGNYSNIKFGAYGRTYINKFVTGYVRFEYLPKFTCYNPENYNRPVDNNIHLSYVGLDFGRWGTLDYGRSYGVMYYPKQFTEKFFDSNENIVFHKDNNFLMGCADGLLTYKNKNFAGYLKNFDIILQHQTHYQRDNLYLSNKYNDSWGMSLTYNSDIGLTLIGSAFFSPYDNSHNGANLTSHWVKSYGVGCHYSTNNISLSGFYGYLKNSAFPYMKDSIRYDLLSTIEVSGEYDFKNGVKTSVAYVKSFGTQYDYVKNVTISKPTPLNHHINLIINYAIHPNIIANLHYKINFLQDSDVPDKEFLHYSENTFGAGLTYNF